MTLTEQWYRALLSQLQDVYIDTVEIAVESRGGAEETWLDFRMAVEELLKWADIVQAQKLRWRGLHERVEVPEHSLSAIVDANKWMKQHTATTWPVIEQEARIVAEIERRFTKERERTIRQEPGAIPLYRLEMLYRNSLGEIVNTAEQVQLSQPEVNAAFPYSEYYTRDDHRVRPTHALMQGFVALRRGEGLKVLSIVRPKNGYNCRCGLRHRAWFEAIDRGWAKDVDKPKWEVKWPNPGAKYNYYHGLFPDPGWDRKKFVASAA